MNQGVTLSRSKFIKTIGLSTAFSLSRGRSWANLIASEIHATAGTSGILRINTRNFPALQAAAGSVRFAITTIVGNAALPAGAIYPVTINKASNTFFAVNSRCTHEGCIVEKMNTTTTIMTCNCHGSRFAVDGTLVAGPASSSLANYTFSFDAATGILTVQIPNLAYSVTVKTVQPVTAGTQRLQLTFSALRNVSYEVQFRESASSPSSVVPFTTTAAGTPNLTTFKPAATTTANLFVDSATATGFYSVAIKASSV